MRPEHAAVLLLGLLACDREAPHVTAQPESASAVSPAASARTEVTQKAAPPSVPSAAVAPPAPAATEAPPAGAPPAASSPAAAIDASQAPTSKPTDRRVCEGAAREGCIPKDDPFGFVARE